MSLYEKHTKDLLVTKTSCVQWRLLSAKEAGNFELFALESNRTWHTLLACSQNVARSKNGPNSIVHQLFDYSRFHWNIWFISLSTRNSTQDLPFGEKVVDPKGFSCCLHSCQGKTNDAELLCRPLKKGFNGRHFASKFDFQLLAMSLRVDFSLPIWLVVCSRVRK